MTDVQAHEQLIEDNKKNIARVEEVIAAKVLSNADESVIRTSVKYLMAYNKLLAKEELRLESATQRQNKQDSPIKFEVDEIEFEMNKCDWCGEHGQLRQCNNYHYCGACYSEAME